MRGPSAFPEGHLHLLCAVLGFFLLRQHLVSVCKIISSRLRSSRHLHVVFQSRRHVTLDRRLHISRTTTVVLWPRLRALIQSDVSGWKSAAQSFLLNPKGLEDISLCLLRCSFRRVTIIFSKFCRQQRAVLQDEENWYLIYSFSYGSEQSSVSISTAMLLSVYPYWTAEQLGLIIL